MCTPNYYYINVAWTVPFGLELHLYSYCQSVDNPFNYFHLIYFDEWGYFTTLFVSSFPPPNITNFNSFQIGKTSPLTNVLMTWFFLNQMKFVLRNYMSHPPLLYPSVYTTYTLMWCWFLYTWKKYYSLGVTWTIHVNLYVISPSLNLWSQTLVGHDASSCRSNFLVFSMEDVQ
jgi:hypothetical protein